MIAEKYTRLEVEFKTGWPSGLRRWIKAPISSGAWVRIQIQSNLFKGVIFSNNGHCPSISVDAKPDQQ